MGQRLFRLPSASTRSPIVLCLELSLDTFLWDGQDQPVLSLPPPKQSHNVLTNDVSSLPCVAVVVPTPHIPPRDLTPTPVQQNPPSLASPRTEAPCLPQVTPVLVTSINLPRRPVPYREDIEGDIFDPAVNERVGGPPTAEEMAQIHHVQEGRRWHGGRYRSDQWILYQICTFDCRGEGWLETPPAGWRSTPHSSKHD